MHVFEIIIAMLVVGAVLASFAQRIHAPYPALVALAGAALALIPGVPALELDPELALALFVAPVLVDAAFDSSQRDMRTNWRTIASLAIGAVILTVVVVAIVAKSLLPDIPWAAAIALGAIVAPPDASAATTVLKALRPPNRLLVILEGESLFNDASALLIYRLAVGATVTGLFSGWSVIPTLLFVTIGSLALAYVLSRTMLSVMRLVDDVAISVVFQFCGAFLVWILAERLHLSGIITTVVFAMLASRRAPESTPARLRIPAFAVWEVAVFVLNVLAFILVGFQLRSIAARVDGATGLRFAAFAAVIAAAVIIARIAWVSGAAAFSRWRCGPGPEGAIKPGDAVALSPRAAIAVGWCGMRGTVTIAAALALPPGFPYRDLILTSAFGVTLATLVVQGLTLRPLLVRLRLEDDGSVDREVRLARADTLRTALDKVKTGAVTGSAQLIVRRYEVQLRRAESQSEQIQTPAPETGPDHIEHPGNDAEVVRDIIGTQRRRLVSLREDGTIGDTAFQRLQEELDWMELGWAQIVLRDR